MSFEANDAPDAVLSGGRPHDVHGIADAGSGGTDDFIGFENAHGHGVHQWIYLVTRVEEDLAADDGHTEAVAIIADAFYNTLQQPLGAGVLEVPNRKLLSWAMGRAPMVKMSRLIPPTPVAAPW